MIRKRKSLLSMIITVVLVLSTFSVMPVCASNHNVPIKALGKIFIIGGAESDNNEELFNALRNATGLEKPRLAVFCTASESYDEAYAEWSQDTKEYLSYQHLYQRYGFDPVFIPIAVDNYQTESYKQSNADLVKSCDAVFFNGGWQERHTRCMFDDYGNPTPVFLAVKEVYDRGGLVSGTSAGCAIMSEITYGSGNSYGYLKANHMFASTIATVNTDDPNDPNNGGYVKGFGFTEPYGAITDSHFMAEGRFARPLVAMRELGKRMAIGVDENTALLLTGNTGRVYGENGVTIFDATGAIFGNGTYYTVDGVTVSYLTSGDEYNFVTKEVTSSKPLAGSSKRVYNSKDIFGSYEASKLMMTLVQSPASTANGYSKEKGPRFIVEFSKTDETKGYYNTVSGKGTVDKLKVCIRYNE